ncbi:Major facilitator superfamily domain, general substrate transporter [Pseudocohnilembus persalinus]|uniref:Lysosomal dipeptide transporter MFSD1 n=1 Tax=Pseudocohnilembus persalinus TaxID=266149 RepID=A0A0V0R134_PSEPJ|nr:Major facilitator superfamily domain, general substrate transporter [Pseudocohnilembus persalinus]|eukprot:KRX07880.1 Major facilitator superfamily domain, general substrate transporter [Pseudocohnilembus persalinus]
MYIQLSNFQRWRATIFTGLSLAFGTYAYTDFITLSQEFKQQYRFEIDNYPEFYSKLYALTLLITSFIVLLVGISCDHFGPQINLFVCQFLKVIFLLDNNPQLLFFSRIGLGVCVQNSGIMASAHIGTIFEQYELGLPVTTIGMLSVLGQAANMYFAHQINEKYGLLINTFASFVMNIFTLILLAYNFIEQMQIEKENEILQETLMENQQQSFQDICHKLQHNTSICSDDENKIHNWQQQWKQEQIDKQMQEEFNKCDNLPEEIQQELKDEVMSLPHQTPFHDRQTTFLNKSNFSIAQSQVSTKQEYREIFQNFTQYDYKFWVLVTIICLFTVVFTMVNMLGNTFVEEQWGMSPSDASQIESVFPMMAWFLPIFGKLVDKYSNQIDLMIAFAMLFSAMSQIFLIYINPLNGFILFGLAYVLKGATNVPALSLILGTNNLGFPLSIEKFLADVASFLFSFFVGDMKSYFGQNYEFVFLGNFILSTIALCFAIFLIIKLRKKQIAIENF